MKHAADPDDVYALIGRVLGSDAMFAPFRQEGYPLDLQGSFAGQLNAVDGSSLPFTELMWVRTIGASAHPNRGKPTSALSERGLTRFSSWRRGQVSCTLSWGCVGRGAA